MYICLCFYRERENECGIELKVMRGNVLSSSLDQAINELSGENSIASIDNVNSIIGKEGH